MKKMKNSINFDFEKTKLEGLYIIKLKPFNDLRGEFTRLYCHEEYITMGLTKNLLQINKSKSTNAGTIRGMHLQTGNYSENKIVTCISGKIYDVAVDMRPDSKTYLNWYGIELSEKNNTSVLIPEGFAHGYQSIEDNSEILYFVTNNYNSLSEDGVHPLDPFLKINWPLRCTEISKKDSERVFIENRIDFKPKNSY
jgi:dTDP-4-dehydrorhamnose 3,5-epimerase